MHIELDISNSRIKYEAGDHVAIYPSNRSSHVENLCQLLNTDPETIFSLINTDPFSNKRSPFPCPCSYRTALTHYVDITSVPRAHVLKEFLRFTTGQEDRDRLTLLTSKTEEGKNLYQTWVCSPYRTIADVLREIPTCRPPLDMVCELLPRLQARYYSISSSPKVHPSRIHVTAVVLRYTTTENVEREGVATSWLFKKNPEISPETPLKVPIFVRKSQFRLPIKDTVPVVMVGPGTGIAPFRGFLQQRAAAKERGIEIGKTILYFGCRNKDSDYLYQEELEAYSKAEVCEVRVAFSRDQEKKVYVQDLIREDGRIIWDIVGPNCGHFYVCGDAKFMAKDVHSALTTVIQQFGEKTTEQTESFVKMMLNKRRYSADVWS